MRSEPPRLTIDVRAPKARHSVATAVRPWLKCLIQAETRRAGTLFVQGAAPSALDYLWIPRSTALRPWLLNDGPSDLNLTAVYHPHPSGTLLVPLS
jgi:hypothetical protein